MNVQALRSLLVRGLGRGSRPRPGPRQGARASAAARRGVRDLARGPGGAHSTRRPAAARRPGPPDRVRGRGALRRGDWPNRRGDRRGGGRLRPRARRRGRRSWSRCGAAFTLPCLARRRAAGAQSSPSSSPFTRRSSSGRWPTIRSSTPRPGTRAEAGGARSRCSLRTCCTRPGSCSWRWLLARPSWPDRDRSGRAGASARAKDFATGVRDGPQARPRGDDRGRRRRSRCSPCSSVSPRRTRARPADDARPNVLVLAADSLRADRLDPRTAPNLSALADRGTRFERAYVSLPRTFPSWVTLAHGTPPPSPRDPLDVPALGRAGPRLRRAPRAPRPCRMGHGRRQRLRRRHLLAHRSRVRHGQRAGVRLPPARPPARPRARDAALAGAPLAPRARRVPGPARDERRRRPADARARRRAHDAVARGARSVLSRRLLLDRALPLRRALAVLRPLHRRELPRPIQVRQARGPRQPRRPRTRATRSRSERSTTARSRPSTTPRSACSTRSKPTGSRRAPSSS